MSELDCDALVFFGATGDLAYKKIFPALQAMVKRGTLNVPVIGIAKSGWTLARLQARARDSLEAHGGVDPAAFEKLLALLRYIDGDYADPATFEALKKALGGAQRPAHYLAIPPLLFGRVVGRLAEAGCTPNRGPASFRPGQRNVFAERRSTACENARPGTNRPTSSFWTGSASGNSTLPTSTRSRPRT